MVSADFSVGGQAVDHRILNISVIQEIGQHSTYEITLDLAQFLIASDGPAFDLMANFKNWIGKEFTLLFKKGEGEVKYLGYIRRVNFSGAQVTLSGIGKSFQMDVVTKSRGFVDQSLHATASSVLAEYNGIGEISAPDSGFTRPFTGQYKETDFGFLSRLAGMEGWMVYDSGEKLIVASEPPSGSGTPLGYKDLPAGDGNLTVEMVPVTVSAVTSGKSPDTLYKADTKQISFNGSDSLHDLAIDAASSTYAGKSTELFDEDAEETNELQQRMENRAKQVASEAVRFEATTNRPEVRLGYLVKIENHPVQHEDLIVIQAVVQYTESRDYYCSFTAVPASRFKGLVQVSISPLETMMTAVVVENTNDPDQVERVRVRLPWAVDAPVWARVATAGAGEEHGAGWTPEVGDEVVVGFSFADPSRPLVLGSLYNETAKPQFETTDSQREILLGKTRKGNEIRITETADSDEIRIVMPESQNEISMKLGGEEPTILIKTAGALNVEGKTVTVKAEKEMLLEAESIEIKAQKTMDLSAEEISINATSALEQESQEIKITGKQSVGVTGQQSLDMKGMQVNVSGDQAIEAKAPMHTVQGDATMKVSGAQVDMGGSAMVKVAAPIIKLN